MDVADYPFVLGDYHFPVSTSDADAATWFDRGMVWIYAFNHEEAVTCFRQAVACDPDMAIGWWGIAYASGPFMNMPWDWFDDDELAQAVPHCHDAISRARACLDRRVVSDIEAALIEACSHRFPSPVIPDKATLSGWERDYADAMLRVYETLPRHPDLTVIYADSQIMLTPWLLWDIQTGDANPDARTLDIINALDEALDGEGADHLGLLHYHIHALEMSPWPERALGTARRLVAAAPPDTGHLHHMPAHIFALCGDYTAAMECSARAVAADEKYLASGHEAVFYRTSICHDMHMQMFSGMQAGHLNSAAAGVTAMTKLLDGMLPYDGKRQMVATLEGYYSNRLHVQVRFGQWADILAEPAPRDAAVFPVSTAMHFYARAVANAALGDAVAARADADHFYEARAAIDPDRMFFNNLALATLGVAEAMMEGELAWHAGAFNLAFDWLESAVRRDDALFYTEPPVWMHPPRHALGALLLAQGHVDRARDVYLTDLGHDGAEGDVPRSKWNQNNIWALHGLHECYQRLGDPRVSDVAAVLNEKLSASDQQILASCCCRREKFK